MDNIVQFFNSLFPDSKGKRVPLNSNRPLRGSNLGRTEAARTLKQAEAMSDAEKERRRVEAAKQILAPVTATQGVLKEAINSTVQAAQSAGQIPSSATMPINRPIRPEDNIYGEIPQSVNPSNSPAQSEFVDGPTPSPFPTYYSPGSFINGGEEIDADNIAISLLGRNAKDPAKGAADAVTRASLGGLKHGGDTAQSQKQEGLINEASDAISGLLGNVDFKGLFRVLARPEFVAPMGPGQTPVTNFINAAAADRTAQATSAAAQQAAGLEGFKAETDRLKALMPDPSKMPKLTGEVSKLYDQLASSQNMANIGERIRATLNTSMAATGGPGAAAQGFRAVAAMFGADIDVNADNLGNMVASLKAEIIKGRLFGREANKQELEILSKLVVGGSFTTNKSQILNALSALTRQAEQRSFEITNRLQAFGNPTDFTEKRKSKTGWRLPS